MIQASNQQQQQAPHSGFWRRNRILLIIALAVPLVAPVVAPVGIALFLQVTAPAPAVEPVSYQMFIDQVEAHNVVSVTITDQSVVGTFKTPVASDQQSGQSGTKFSTTIPNLAAENPVALMEQNGVKIVVQPDNSNSFLPTLLLQWGPILTLWYLVYLFMLGCLGGYLYGRRRPSTEHTPA